MYNVMFQVYITEIQLDSFSDSFPLLVLFFLSHHSSVPFFLYSYYHYPHLYFGPQPLTIPCHPPPSPGCWDPSKQRFAQWLKW